MLILLVHFYPGCQVPNNTIDLPAPFGLHYVRGVGEIRREWLLIPLDFCTPMSWTSKSLELVLGRSNF